VVADQPVGKDICDNMISSSSAKVIVARPTNPTATIGFLFEESKIFLSQQKANHDNELGSFIQKHAGVCA
jgi:hypothetical protein